jgi:hypothetical protein
LTHYLIEKFLGIPSPDWIQTYIDLDKEENAKFEKARQQRNDLRAKDTRPSLELEKYAGAYKSSILAEATIRVEGDALRGEVSPQRHGEAISKRDRLRIQLQAHKSITGTLEHWHYDSFLCKWDDPVLGESLIPFTSDGQGQVAEFRMKIREDWIDPLEHVFKRVN